MSRPKELCEACYPGNACAWCLQRLGHRAVELALVWEIKVRHHIDDDPIIMQARRLVSTLGPMFGKIQFTPEDLL